MTLQWKRTIRLRATEDNDKATRAFLTIAGIGGKYVFPFRGGETGRECIIME